MIRVYFRVHARFQRHRMVLYIVSLTRGRMPAEKKVSVAWQIVFMFLPIVNFWAFYRIRRLRRYVLYIIIPQIIISIAIGAYTSSTFAADYPDFGFGESADPLVMFSNPIIIASYAISFALQGLTIYLIIIWSGQHNRRFDQSTLQPPR